MELGEEVGRRVVRRFQKEVRLDLEGAKCIAEGWFYRRVIW